MQAFGDFQPIHGVDPVEVFRDQAAFIALNRADEVPNDVRMAYLRHLIYRLLRVVFAEIPLARLISFLDIGGGFRLAHG